MQPLSNSFVHFVDERHYWSVQASCVLYWVRWQLCLVQHDDRKKLKETEIYLDFDGFQVIMSPIVIFKSNQIKSNQITFIVTSPQHKCLGEWNSYECAPDSGKKTTTSNLHMDRQCKKNNKQFTYGQTVQKKQQAIYIWTDSAKKLHWSIYSAPDSAKKTTTIYIWTVHIYRLYRRQCAKYTYIYSVHIVYYKDTLNYQRHIIHRMGTSTLCTVSIHNVVYT